MKTNMNRSHRRKLPVAVIATKMAARLKTGGRCFAFGNGGSATDATALVQLLAHPPYGRPLAARALVADQAVLTALANDIGFDVVYARQLIAHARPGDVAIGFSTSGNSANVIAAFVEARRRDVLTIGFAGYDGGQMAASPDLEHCLVVRAESIHRIQEAQASLAYLLFEQVERAIANDRSEP
jgi:D-sedoheptulose 7-phosphate isomerase